jgi:hypothetical protein
MMHLKAMCYLAVSLAIFGSCKSTASRIRSDDLAAADPKVSLVNKTFDTVAASASFVDSLRQKDQNGRAYWNMPSRLGLQYSSQYYLFLRWMGKVDSKLDVRRLKDELLQTVRPDGSWYAVEDVNPRNDGSLLDADFNATIFSYWALKVFSFRNKGRSLGGSFGDRHWPSQSHLYGIPVLSTGVHAIFADQIPAIAMC